MSWMRLGSRVNLGRSWVLNFSQRYCAQAASSEAAKYAIKEQAGHVRSVWKNGSWSAPEWVEGSNGIYLHIHASVLHYGGAVFEGLKAFQHKDGQVTLCNAPYNAERMQLSAKRMALAEVPSELFLDACMKAIVGNRAMIPSYQSEKALYVRPFLMATGATLGVKIPCEEYTFLVSVQPLGNFVDPAGVEVRLAEYDRAAPRGTGFAKAAGNYAASVAELHQAIGEGYMDILYVDAATRQYIDEFHGANFMAVSRETGAIVTPDSPTILKSSTRGMLLQLAEDEGLKVEKREVPLTELLSGGFSEVAAIGTSYIVSRVRSLTANGTKHDFGELNVLQKLRQRFTSIQRGDAEDKFGWNLPVSFALPVTDSISGKSVHATADM